MIYIFTFLGEFGFELLNWQGVIRRFAQTIQPTDTIVCCSRANLYLLYEYADIYLDISEVEMFRQSRAGAYYALPTSHGGWNSFQALRFDRRLKGELKRFISQKLYHQHQLDCAQSSRFIFSSDGVTLHGCTFGPPQPLFSPAGMILIQITHALKTIMPRVGPKLVQGLKQQLSKRLQKPVGKEADGDIYGTLAVANNRYQKIEPDLTCLPQLEQKLGFDLSEPFVLCQTRQRTTAQLSSDKLPQMALQRLIQTISQQLKVVLLSFSTHRWLDSYSEFVHRPDCYHYHATTFPEQACLIHYATHCLFFTEGDFGSHLYLPPLMGNDVIIIAPASIYQLESTPIDFWNRHVFQFGGQMRPHMAEDIFASPASVSQFLATEFQISL